MVLLGVLAWLGEVRAWEVVLWRVLEDRGGDVMVGLGARWKGLLLWRLKEVFRVGCWSEGCSVDCDDWCWLWIVGRWLWIGDSWLCRGECWPYIGDCCLGINGCSLCIFGLSIEAGHRVVGSMVSPRLP
jgi:hypothetical protein